MLTALRKAQLGGARPTGLVLGRCGESRDMFQSVRTLSKRPKCRRFSLSVPERKCLSEAYVFLGGKVGPSKTKVNGKTCLYGCEKMLLLREKCPSESYFFLAATVLFGCAGGRKKSKNSTLENVNGDRRAGYPLAGILLHDFSEAICNGGVRRILLSQEGSLWISPVSIRLRYRGTLCLE